MKDKEVGTREVSSSGRRSIHKDASPAASIFGTRMAYTRRRPRGRLLFPNTWVKQTPRTSKINAILAKKKDIISRFATNH